MIPHIKGVTTKQAHVGVPDGTFEDEFARNGFTGRYAHLYRTEPPVNWTSIDGPLKPRAYKLKGLPSEKGADYLASRKLTLFNADVKIYWSTLSEAMPYFFRNADADELLFVHQGKGIFESDFGDLPYEVGDYLAIPRGTSYRLSPAKNSSTELLTIESFSELRFPDKGMLGQHALFDPAVIEVPSPKSAQMVSQTDHRPCELRIQRLGAITKVQYPKCPVNAVGWKGTLHVSKINVRDIRPVLSDRYHLPPSAHTTFVADRFVVCSFLPRPLENGDPKAMKVPFYHLNIDFDEVLFYHSGDFFSRTGIEAGMLTYHPQGIHHGPQAGAIDRAKDTKATQEVAVMIDTRVPLQVADGLSQVEVENYYKSWSQAK